MWIAKLKDETVITKDEHDPKPFSAIQHLVIRLGYKYRESEFWLPEGMIDYKYGGSATASIGGGITIDSYWIQAMFQSDFKKLRVRFHNLKNAVEIETF